MAGSTDSQTLSIDALVPREMARKAEDVGIGKARLDGPRLFALAVLAGSFISFGAMLSTIASAGLSTAPYGVSRLFSGFVFSVGLILVVVGGAELFTGNHLLVMAWASRKVSAAAVLRNWLIVYAGNFAGSLLTAGLVFLSEEHMLGKGAVGAAALAVANAKCGLSFVPALARGILCNALVCLAVWLSMSARSSVDRIVSVVPPITAFVAAGFEHSVANMYFIPMGFLIQRLSPSSFWASIGADPASFSNLSMHGFFVRNLLPVTIGNLIGGVGLVGLVYWFIYLRGQTANGCPAEPKS
jgi:formate/nitrite transporter